MIDIDNINYYEYSKESESRIRTRNRLIEINNLGLVSIGIGQFGIEGIMSGLYIEKVWSYTDVEWDSYIEWIKEIKSNKV